MNNILSEADAVRVYGARVHNLKNIDVTLPHGKLCVVTGLSGSGKSSLAFDTIFAEGQRRYIETFSAYARNMMGNMERPDVDKITGLSPVISIEQKTVNKNPRSTIGTTTEVYDFFRLLYARIGEARSYLTGNPMVKYTREKILDLIATDYAGRKIFIMAPLVKNRKGHYKELFENYRKKGFLYVRVDGEIRELTPGMRVDRYKNHTIELVVDRLKADSGDSQRLRTSVENALKIGGKQIAILDVESEKVRVLSQMLMDPESGLSYSEPAPHNFSFNSPKGACPSCRGLGYINRLDVNKVVPKPEMSIYDGGIEPLGKYKNTLVFWQIEALCGIYGCTLNTPINELPKECFDEIMYGSDKVLTIKKSAAAIDPETSHFKGLETYMNNMIIPGATDSEVNKMVMGYFSNVECPECHGKRLNKEALHFFVDGKNIDEISRMDLSDLYAWVDNLEERLPESKRIIAEPILKEIRSRLSFMLDVGLNYLSLGRESASLSGGESQRIRLATQIGSQLVNVLYILDEPSIGLHQRDNDKLIASLQQLRDNGNSIIVVEHDRDIMERADYIVDVGPGAGRDGGEVVFAGTPAEMLKTDTLTAQYLNGKRCIEVPKKRREGNGKTLEIKGATGHNLKDVDLKLPLGKFICVTGVSGSGKSSLINGTLNLMLAQKLHHAHEKPLPYREVIGLENVDKVITVDQSPLGRTPRSNPATYTGVFTEIRKLFVNLPEAKIRGYKPGRFSFNIAGGRCETCKGNGYRTIEMNFLPDVLVPCEECQGRRYNRETLEVRYRGKSISDVLEMTVDQAVEFFANIPSIYKKLKVLQEIGLGYIKLGQPSSTLSGGENQRVKLSAELARKATGNTVFILDEPTTGLHFEDIRVLLKSINKLVEKGNTVIVIEHNIDMIRCADYIIDMGPEGGREGGCIIAEGTPEEIALTDTHTARYLRPEDKANDILPLRATTSNS